MQPGREGSSPLTRGKRSTASAGPREPGLIPAHAGKTRSGRRGQGGGGAHPRSRGENIAVEINNPDYWGSSPLTRGKLKLESVRRGGRGLIPAHAGKTRRTVRRFLALRAHPRSRGENHAVEGTGHAGQGSSPLTRGKLTGSTTGVSPTGLIPAHAGKTDDEAAGACDGGAHPRSRGENVGAHCLSPSLRGSSPLTRGKQYLHEQGFYQTGLIPAHAGKTLGVRRRSWVTRAHPRSRGENQAIDSTRVKVRGSSPLTRGKLIGGSTALTTWRLIPAHAGKTPCLVHGHEVERAHPRSRGENESRSPSRRRLPGSSPLTRGKLFPWLSGKHVTGLIPAHAGKTLPRSQRETDVWAHPRSRGENAFDGGDDGGEAGSSPLTRGKLHLRDQQPYRDRLIPAHAGKTAPYSALVR